MKRSAVIIAVVVVALALTVNRFAHASPLLRHPIVTWRLWHMPRPAHEPVPVEGVVAADLEDSWGSPRSEGRHHEGIDIFAPRGTPIRSATDGIVLSVGENRLGGHVVRVAGPGGEWHYYAHMDHFGSVQPGDIVHAGDVLGYVGNTGDAARLPCHLHYGIYRAPGRATNPYPRLR